MLITLEQRRNQASLTMLQTGQCRSQSSYNYTKQQNPYSPLKNKTPYELIFPWAILILRTDNCTRICK